MIKWGPETFGDPCRGCGFDWSTSVDQAASIVDDAPRRLKDLTANASGRTKHEDIEWSVSGYLFHIGDSIRIWAERIASVALGNTAPVALYDQDLLATARHYDDIDIATARWNLDRALGDWHAALTLVGDGPFTMTHSEVGEMGMTDIMLIRAHDVVHHAGDIARIVRR
jgi:hypothetical protein